MTSPSRGWSARLPLVVGFSAVALLLGGLGAWSFGTQIAGAVVAPGIVKVESERQVIQHPDGGVVGEINVRDGARVSAGDVLVRLDDTFLKTELTVVERQLLEIFARKARLEAERDDAETPVFGPVPEYTLLDDTAIRAQIAGQKSLFDARRVSLAQEARQLEEQQAQIDRQIEGTEAQLSALDRQLELIVKERTDVQGLFDRGLVQASRLLELQREEARLLGEVGRLTALIAEARTRISGLAIEILKLTDRRREEAITRLRDIQYSEIELEERRISLIEQMSRLDVRSPVDGTIFGSRVFAIQSVVQPAEPMMFVVPGGQPLTVSARIDPVHVDQVYPGQDVKLMFTTFNRRTTPEVSGVIQRVSADAARDETTGVSYYEAVITPSAEELAALPEVKLLPGMPVEAFIRTSDRTPLSYLTQPLMVYFNRSFREE